MDCRVDDDYDDFTCIILGSYKYSSLVDLRRKIRHAPIPSKWSLQFQQ